MLTLGERIDRCENSATILKNMFALRENPRLAVLLLRAAAQFNAIVGMVAQPKWQIQQLGAFLPLSSLPHRSKRLRIR